MRTYSTRKRILVTGGAGFLGSHHLFGWPRPAASRLCERLLKEDNDVLCADNFFTGTKDNIAHLLPDSHFELMRHDVNGAGPEPTWLERRVSGYRIHVVGATAERL